MNRLRDALLLVLLLGVGIAAGGGGTFAKWSSATDNTGNQLRTGTMDVSVNSSTPMFAMAGVVPGTQPSKCVVVTNSGTVKTTVALYGQISGTLVPYLTMKVDRGQKGGTCASPGSSTTIYDGALGSFPTTSGGAIADAGEWMPADSYPYTFTLTLANDPGAQGKTATVGMTWEGRP